MKPRLAALSGPHAGAVHPLGEGAFTIGRDGENELRLEDRLASRKHCRIENEGGDYRITDLESTNATLVNGVPVKQNRLRHGDQIQIGESVFLFLLDDAAGPSGPVAVELRENILAAKSVELSYDQAAYISGATLPGTEPPSRVERDLRALVHVSMAVNSVQGLEELAGKLLAELFDVVPAAHGAILLLDEAGQIAARYARSRDETRPGSVSVSRTVVESVLVKGVAVLCNDVLDGHEFDAAPSLHDVRSVLAVPLVCFGRRLGVLYLDSATGGRRFDVDHLQLVTAVAGMAAPALDRARQVDRLDSENARLREDLAIEHNMVGEAPVMRGVYDFVAKVAPSEATVLILGESGTGKELVARAIHRNSLRAERPFVAINCAALAEALLESELFGHEKGAFTGAVAQKKGKLEIAHGGSVFLDEIGELAPGLQAKLLRVLQEREIERVGGTRPIKIDVRVIAATNRDLAQAVQAGTFREDLYYRINVVSLRTPTLRERREDVPLLARYFAAKYAEKCNRRVTGIHPAARDCLLDYPWPGNVRELENTIERAVVLGSTEVILPEDLPEQVLETCRPSAPDPHAPLRYHEAVAEAKRRLILRAFEESQGSHARAAKLLDVHPNYLHRLLRNLDLRGPLKSRGDSDG